MTNERSDADAARHDARREKDWLRRFPAEHPLLHLFTPLGPLFIFLGILWDLVCDLLWKLLSMSPQQKFRLSPTRECPYCREYMDRVATACPYCLRASKDA